MRKAATTKERLWMSCIKELPCAVCEAPPPSDVHHIVNGYRLGHMYTIPLCFDCHRGDQGFSGKYRDAWDKSLKHQLELHEKTCYKLGASPPKYKSKVVDRNSN